MEERIDFIEQLLQEAEKADQEHRVEVDRLRADQILAAIGKLEEGMYDVNQLCDKELKMIEEHHSNELARLDKKRSWFVFNLDGFMRSTGDKTLRLPHGILKLRKGRDIVAITALDQFLIVGSKLGLVRTVPEEIAPDLQAIVNHIRTTGEIPAGVEFISGDTKFSYTTTSKEESDERE
jgi:Bacteriophage Mu Gam like protein